jgi:hypothetical protein
MKSGTQFHFNEIIDVSRFRRDVYSQSGEDGILEAVFNRLGISRGYFVEFGAWDGICLSNTRRLLEKGWHGLYIEGDSRKIEQLKRNCRPYEVEVVQRYVTATGAGRLDNILAEVGAPPDLDLLSIDIDSDDLAVFRSLRHARAKVVVIEFNPSIPSDIEYENPAGRNHGNSALSITRYAQSIGYDLAAITTTNLIFVDHDHLEASAIKPIKLERTTEHPRFFFGFDGTLVCVGSIFESNEPEMFVLPWHPYRIRQPLPKYFRTFRIGLPWVVLNILRSVGPLAVTHPRAFAEEVATTWSRAAKRRKSKITQHRAAFRPQARYDQRLEVSRQSDRSGFDKSMN